MDWQQIEQKWDEMTRRVQPPSTLSAIHKIKPKQSKTELSSAIDPAVLPRMTESSTAGKLYE